MSLCTLARGGLLQASVCLANHRIHGLSSTFQRRDAFSFFTTIQHRFRRRFSFPKGSHRRGDVGSDGFQRRWFSIGGWRVILEMWRNWKFAPFLKIWEQTPECCWYLLDGFSREMGKSIACGFRTNWRALTKNLTNPPGLQLYLLRMWFRWVWGGLTTFWEYGLGVWESGFFGDHSRKAPASSLPTALPRGRPAGRCSGNSAPWAAQGSAKDTKDLTGAPCGECPATKSSRSVGDVDDYIVIICCFAMFCSLPKDLLVKRIAEKTCLKLLVALFAPHVSQPCTCTSTCTYSVTRSRCLAIHLTFWRICMFIVDI